MFKSPRRNGRNKGFKIKHVIQISMLLGVSIWLLYQIHHSDDKKSSVAIKISEKLDDHDDSISSREIVKLGRKDLRPRVKGTKADDEQKDETDGLEDVEDRESEEREEVGENEQIDGKEESEEMKERDNDNDNEHEKDDDDKGRDRDQVVVVKDVEKKMSPSEDGDGDDDQSVRGVVKNDKMKNNGENESVEGNTGSSKQPAVDDDEHNSKEQIAEQIDAAPDSYSYKTDKKMKASEVQSKNGESKQKDDVSIQEEEKDVFTEMETLPENGTGGRITL